MISISQKPAISFPAVSKTHWIDNSGTPTANMAPTFNALETALAQGGTVNLLNAQYLIGTQITKGAYINWEGVAGTDPANPTTTPGSQLVANFDGTLVAWPTTGSLYAAYAGVRGVNFYNPDRTAFANAIAIASNGNVRQVPIEGCLIKNFKTGISGPWSEFYPTLIFISGGKYGFLQVGSADSWYEKCHAGSGLSADSAVIAFCTGGTGFYMANCVNLTFRECRGQVQIGGYGWQFLGCSRVALITCFADASELVGMRLINCHHVDITDLKAYDNGTTSVNGIGLKIEAVSDTFTADAGTDEITLTGGNGANYWGPNHMIVEVSNSGGGLPAPLAAGTEYYLINGSAAGKFKLAASYADATAGTAIDLTTAGTGTQSLLGVIRNINIRGGFIGDRQKGTASQKQSVGIQFVKTALNGAAKGKIRDITLDGVDLSQNTTPIQYTDYVDSGLRITNCPGISGASICASSSQTLRVGVYAPVQIVSNALAADVTLTLSQDGAFSGAEFKICRTPASTGAFNLIINNSAASALATVGADATKVQEIRATYLAGSVNEWVLSKSVGG